MQLLAVFVITGLVVALAVVIHYETLYQLSRHLECRRATRCCGACS